MAGSIYGVDVKLTPGSNGQPVPVGIELNGVDSGTDFFRYQQGWEYYLTFARELSRTAGKKPIFIEAASNYAVGHLETAARVSKFKEVTEERKQILEGFQSRLPSADYYLEMEWLDDVVSFEAEHSKRPPEFEESFYSMAGQEAGVQIIPYSQVSFGQDWLGFRLLNGKSVKLKESDVGLVRPSSSTLKAVPERFKHLFLNNDFTEDVLDSKVLTWYIGKVWEPNFLECFPRTLPYGFGIGNLSDLFGFIEGIDTELVVRKPSSLSRGVGVAILRKDELLSKLHAINSPVTTHHQQQEMAYLAVNYAALFGDFFDEFLSVYQPFVESVPIVHPQTGQLHDGCARVMVYSSPDGRIVTLGSQWRLAPKPLSDESAGLEDRLRANLSRGATAVPVHFEQERIVAGFAENLVKYFEHGLSQAHDSIGEQRDSFLKHGGNLSDVDILRIIVLSEQVIKRMKAIGAYDAKTGRILTIGTPTALVDDVNALLKGPQKLYHP